MKSLLKLAALQAAVLATCAAPLAANAALQYTPPQAMVLTCNGSAPNVLNKTSALATFACANGQVPQAVGVTSGLGDLLGLASGAAVLAASEAVPQLALPSSAPASGGPASGNGSNGSGNGSGNGAGSGSGSGNGSGNGSNSGSGNGSGSKAGSGSNAGNGSASGSNASNGANGSGNASGANSGNGSNGSGSGNGSGYGSGNGAGSGSGNGSNGSSAGNGTGSGGGSGSGSGSGSGGGFLGHLLNSVGSVVQQVGQAVMTGGTVNIPLMGGASTPAQGAIAENGGNNTDNTGYSGFNSLNHYTQANKPTTPVSIMTGAAPGTIEIHSQPQPFVLTGGPAAYRGLVRWVSGYESMLGSGGGHLDTVVHPGTVTPERLADGPNSYFPYNRMTGTVDLYITESGHKYIAYPGNPVSFVSQRGTGQGYIQPSIWMAADNIAMQAANTYASGPQFYTSVPGNRNGPFWPSPFTIGSPGLDTASVCHGMRQITHVSLGAFCWSSRP